MKKKESLLTEEEQELLKQSRLVRQMLETKGWQEIVAPYLRDKLNKSFPDPSQFKDENEFLYAAKVASVFKKVVAEILGWVEQKVEEVKYLEKKEKGEIIDNFSIGGE